MLLYIEAESAHTMIVAWVLEKPAGKFVNQIIVYCLSFTLTTTAN